MAEDIQKTEIITEEIREALKIAMENLHTEIQKEVEREWQNAEKLSNFLLRLEKQQDQLMAHLENLVKTFDSLAKSLHQLLQASNNERPTYAT